MEVKSQKVNAFIFFLLFTSHLPLVAPTNTWVGSKYQIECTMCAACDNPCNQHPPPPPPSPPTSTGGGGYYYSPPPPSPPTSTGGGYYYSPPPPSSGTGGGNYYSPPPPSQGVYYGQPPPYNNYPTPGSPNPMTDYYPYYYHNSPKPYSAAAVSLSGATVMLLINTLLIYLL